ncbi:MAG: chromosome segregation protein SMC [bacterium]|nr:chromosome segregation protein SMC [bacterium]
MILKSIEIQGFKSFADKTVLKFGKGITAVVGPNGSGKSNISDAVRWVLGEQSTKSLRGQAMEDVIFSGTSSRRAGGFAEVTISIDNSDRTLNFDNDSVSVTRRYYRSHESEYLINNAVVRLKDIHELFMDTGLGRDGYSMIGQGKIDSIVRSRSDERRDIFEEASGISRFRYRKTEAERKLALADENLVRLKDIMIELEDRVGPLAKQSEKAKQFLELSGSKKDLEIGLWVNSLRESNEKLTEQDKKISLVNLQYKDTESELFEIASSIEKSSDDFSTITVKIDENRREIAMISEEIAELKGNIALCENTVLHNNELINIVNNDINELTATESTAGKEIEARCISISEKKAEIEKINELVLAAEKDLADLITDSESISKSIEEYTKQLNTISQKDSDNRVGIVTAESSVSEIEKRMQIVEESVAVKTEQLEENSKELSRLKNFLQAQEEKITECSNALKGYELKEKSRSSKLEELKQKVDRSNLDIEAKKHRVTILEDLERNMEGFSFAVKSVVNAAKGGILRGVHGPVSKLINVNDGCGVAIEVALGASLQNIVVDTDADAKSAISMLKKENKGRATFLPISSIKSRQLDEKGIDDCVGFVGIASKLLTTDKKYIPIVENLLGKTVVSDSIDSAVAIAKKYGYRFKVVSLDGQVVNAGGSLTGGSLSKNAGVLSRAGDIKRLKTEIDGMISKTALLVQEYEAAKADYSKVQAELLNIKSELNTANEDKIRVLGEIRRVDELCKTVESEISMLSSEKLSIQQRVVELKNTISHYQKVLEDIMAERTGIEARIEEMTGGRDSVSAKRQDLSEQITAQKIRIMEINKDIDALNESVSMLEASISDREHKQEELVKSIEQLKSDNESQYNKIREINNDINDKTRRIEEINTEITDLSDKRNSADKFSQEQRVAEREKMTVREKLNAEIARLEERREAMLREYDEITRKLFDEYELTITQAEENCIVIEDISAAKKELMSLKNQIRALGNVNVAAIEEYAEVSERYEFMKSQMSDIEDSRVQLIKLIESLTTQMVEQFVSGFNKINIEFQKIFTDLFGGGSASLVLTDSENILQSGIDIVANLPGKKVPSLEGLSGGEKALIAIAIYFAIMRINPPPFCFLDEVDTALDDINVERFAEYMHKTNINTQFICITHRRGTMDSADMLYGVTMQEKGITKLLELDVSSIIEKMNIK